MSLETKRIKELFGYARTLTKEQGVGVMAGRAVGFFKRRFFGKKARYLPSKQTLEAQRADAAARADGWPIISILTPLYNTPPQFLQQFLDSVQAQTAPNWQLVLVDASDGAHPDVGETVRTRAAARLGLVQDILVEINIGEEASKSGVDADSLFPLLEAAAAREHIRLRGLMAIPPADADNTETRRFFAQMRELLARADARHYDRAQMDILSMGMSHDYAAAIAEGATIVRVGTAIYGARDYSKKA